MKVRPAKKEDIDEIMTCVKRVKKEYFEANKIPQWQGDYPSRDDFLSDLNSGSLFVMHLGECLIGFASIKIADDPCYSDISDGEWKNNSPYAVIHRFAINPDWHHMGMGTSLIALADKICEAKNISGIRADTHEDNAAMIGLLEKNGYIRRGIIHLANGDPRVAFEKIL